MHCTKSYQETYELPARTLAFPNRYELVISFCRPMFLGTNLNLNKRISEQRVDLPQVVCIWRTPLHTVILIYFVHLTRWYIRTVSHAMDCCCNTAAVGAPHFGQSGDTSLSLTKGKNRQLTGFRGSLRTSVWRCCCCSPAATKVTQEPELLAQHTRGVAISCGFLPRDSAPQFNNCNSTATYRTTTKHVNNFNSTATYR